MENFFEAPLYRDGATLSSEILESSSETQEMLKILLESKETGKAIGICSPLTGEGFVITVVEDIILDEAETTITIKPYDVTGFMLPVYKIQLSQITAVCPLKSNFGNPLLKNLDKGKSWFF
jgi:hypothetical protein